MTCFVVLNAMMAPRLCRRDARQVCDLPKVCTGFNWSLTWFAVGVL